MSPPPFKRIQLPSLQMKSLEEERLRALEAAARARAEVRSKAVVWSKEWTDSDDDATH